MEAFEVVALTRDIEGTHLKAGDLGAIVDVIANGKAFIVEFVLQTGFTAALEEIDISGVRPLREGELERERYREWKPEWTGVMGDCPPISEILECEIPPEARPAHAHYLGYVDGAGG